MKVIRSPRSNLSKLRTRLPQPARRFVPALEQLEGRFLPSTLIQLDSSGSGFRAGIINPATFRAGIIIPPTPDAFDFTATVPGRILVLMQAEQQGMQSLLTGASGTTFSDETFLPSQLRGARDHLVQFNNVAAGEVFHLSAGVPYDPTKPPPVVGAYQLYISTKSTDFSATTPHMISLDSSGLGVQLGTIETPGEADLFAFTASVTGQALVRVDGGAISSQELRIDTIPGQTYGIRVSDAGNNTGPYVLTVIADDATVHDFDLSKTSTLSGTFKFADDVDSFRFTATQDGVMTLTMQNQPGSDDISTLQCALSVSGATGPFDVDISPPRRSFNDTPANDRIVQFEVVKGRQYTIRASGANGSIGSYLLSLSLAVDDFSERDPLDDDDGHVTSLDLSSGAATQTGSIEVPGDQDSFQFTATLPPGVSDGNVVVALMPKGSSPGEPGTNMQGLLTFPATTPIVKGKVIPPFPAKPFSGPLEHSSGAGWMETTRDYFAAIQVKSGETYEFFVSADDNTFGDYTLALTTYTSGAMPTFTTRSDGNPLPSPPPNLGFQAERKLTFNFSTANPSLRIEDVQPFQLEIVPAPPTSPTNTRLAAFTLPSSNTSTPSSNTSTSPATGTPATVTVPSGQATGASNSLIATLLTVAARDNSAQSTDKAVAAGLGPSDAASTLLATLLVGLVAPTSEVNSHIESARTENDPNTNLLIRGTVFHDLDGDGRQAAHEPGVPGETVLLEVQKDGRYVVVNTATTDAKGAYVFTNVKPGDYRVRWVTAAGSGSDPTTSTSYTVKVTRDSKPRTFNFGKVGKRGATRTDRGQRYHCRVVDGVVPLQQTAVLEELNRVEDWDEVGGAASDWWSGLLAPIATLAVARIQWDIPAIERRSRKTRMSV
jgi:hypothetical protein